MKRYLTIPLLLACLTALAGDPRDGVPGPEPSHPQPAPTNPPSGPQQLELVKAAEANARTNPAHHLPPTAVRRPAIPPAADTNAPAPPVYPAAREPKAIAIILRNVHAVQTAQGNVLLVPERYLSDLTNIYHSVLIPKLALEEP